MDDVKETISIGILLAVFVVFFFLANGRSTIITGLALPNSLIGAFLLMAIAGFTINIMTLLALSLAVGLLVDDAIVVRENIFRHIEMGKSPIQAALEGTDEVRLAVIATTLTVIAVFGPLGFLKGVVGQFFKQFGSHSRASRWRSVCSTPSRSRRCCRPTSPARRKFAKKGIYYYTIGSGLARVQPLSRLAGKCL